MVWQAKPGCAEHHYTVIEYIINVFPPTWLLPPCTGEIFDSLEDCNCRLKTFSLAEGFDIIYKDSSIQINLTYKFSYYYYRDKMRNNYKFKNSVKYNKKDKIINNY